MLPGIGLLLGTLVGSWMDAHYAMDHAWCGGAVYPPTFASPFHGGPAAPPFGPLVPATAPAMVVQVPNPVGYVTSGLRWLPGAAAAVTESVNHSEDLANLSGEAEMIPYPSMGLPLPSASVLVNREADIDMWQVASLDSTLACRCLRLTDWFGLSSWVQVASDKS